MKTRNERIQQLLSEGLNEARRRNMGAQEDGFCAAYLASKCADVEVLKGASPDARADVSLQQWIKRYPELVFDALQDIEESTLADLIFNPEELGKYVISELKKGMDIDTSFQDANRKAEPDLWDPVNGYRLDELGVG